METQQAPASPAAAVRIAEAVVIACALDIYAKTGVKANRAYTPKAMMQAATRITGLTFKTRDYEGAALALRAFAQEIRA